jgi:DNA-binding LacI/PurR family transcriptional regulator
MGKAAAEKLFEKARKGATEPTSEFTPALIERQSTAPPPNPPSRRT